MASAEEPIDRDPAVRAHRAHQGWWREKVLGRPAGPPTSAGSSYETLTNCLGREHDGMAAAAEGLNLMSPAARQYATDRMLELGRLGGLAEPDRLWRNLLSSQPLAFSIVGELRAHPEAAAAVLAQLTGLPGAELARLEGGAHCLAGLEAEWFPPRERHTNDRSGFDAAAYLRLPDGTDMLVTIEVKYTDTFSPAQLDPRRYEQALRDYGLDGVGVQDIVDAGGSQFLRSVLLTDSVRRSGVDGNSSCLGRALAVVLCRADDHTAAAVVDAIGKHPAGTEVQLWTHEALFAAAESQPALHDWAIRMKERYLLPADAGLASAHPG